jgi:CRP-like cAMP-binding protein
VVRLSLWGKHPAGTTLIHENESGDFFYILASGQAKVIKRGKLLNLIEAGECVGDMAYLTNALKGTQAPRTADVVTLNQATTIKLTHQALSGASQTCRYRFDRAFLNILVERLTLANNRLTA